MLNVLSEIEFPNPDLLGKMSNVSLASQANKREKPSAMIKKRIVFSNNLNSTKQVLEQIEWNLELS